MSLRRTHSVGPKGVHLRENWLYMLQVKFDFRLILIYPWLILYFLFLLFLIIILWISDVKRQRKLEENQPRLKKLNLNNLFWNFNFNQCNIYSCILAHQVFFPQVHIYLQQILFKSLNRHTVTALMIHYRPTHNVEHTCLWKLQQWILLFPLLHSVSHVT